MGHDTFILLSNNTIVDCDIDINYHARTSKEMGMVPLKRLVQAPYHHTDSKAFTQNDSTHNTAQEPLGFYAFQLAMYATFDEKARHLQHTGKRLRHTVKRRQARNPTLVTEAWLSSEWDPVFMSEIALQGLLDRTKADEQDEDAMDMTVINGIRMSKYDIRALKVGLKVTPELRNALIEFNKGFIGENSVLDVKNGAPRILEQFKDNPYTLELLDQYTTGNKPKRLPPTTKASPQPGKS
jgi:hypothetical protein